MSDISKEYLTLFNAITDAAAELEAIRERLIFAQIEAEKIYIEEEIDSEVAEIC